MGQEGDISMLGAAGIGAASGVAGAGMSAMLAQGQHRRQRALMGYQQNLQQGLNQQGHDLNYDMWKKTNYPAQIEMMKEAGLNPSMIYGKGGAGGQTGGQGGGAAAGGSAAMPMMGNMGGVDAMTASQIQVNKASAYKMEVEANKLKGVDTELVETNVLSLTQGIENQKAVQELTKVQTAIAEVTLKIQEASSNDQMESLYQAAQKAKEDVRSIWLRNNLDSATLDDKIKQVNSEMIGAGLKNILTRSQVNLTDAKITEVAASIDQKWEALIQSGDRVDIERFTQEIKAEFPSLMSVGGKLMNELYDMAGYIDGRHPQYRSRTVK
jgi:hypothetical protein